MAVSSPPILKILSDLDIDLMDINNDVDYLRALMEATNALTITNASDKRIPILQDEIQRVRADRKAADPKFKQRVKKTKVDPAKITGRKMLIPGKGMDDQKLLPTGDSKKITSQGDSNVLADILVSITSIRDLIINQIKQKRTDSKKKRRAAENAKRDKKESGLEMVKKGFGALKSGVSKVIEPVKSLFGQVFGFIGKIILGRVLFKLIEWFQDKKNQKKVAAIGKFLKKTWPVLLAAFLLFGTSFGRMAVKLGVMITRFSVKLVRKIIPALVKAIAKMKIGSFLKKIPGFNKGGEVPGSGNTDTVPAMLTPGEFVMSKGAVQQYGVDTLEGMNAAAGGTNIPTLGVVTDPKEKAQQEAYMLKFVNEERALQGMEPLENLTYAPGVELTKMRGPGPRTKQTSHTDFDFNTGMKTTTRSKTVDGKLTGFEGSSSQITPEEREKFFAENPHAAQLVNLKDQMELDALGADISASAKMNGGGLVQMFQGGGQVMQMGRGASKNRMKLAAQQKKMNTPGTSSGKKTTVAYQDQGGSMKSAGGARQPGNKELPSFSATAMRSPDKIRVLGISV